MYPNSDWIYGNFSMEICQVPWASLLPKAQRENYQCTADKNPIAATTNPITAAKIQLQKLIIELQQLKHPITAAKNLFTSATNPITAAKNPIAAATNPITAAKHQITAAIIFYRTCLPMSGCYQMCPWVPRAPLDPPPAQSPKGK